MSVYRDTANGTVSFSHPIGTPLTATVKNSAGVVLETVADIPAIQDFATGVPQYIYTPSWQVTQYDGTFTVEWSGADGQGNPFLRTSSFSVLTPIVDFDRLMAVYPDQFAPAGDLQNLEAIVRTMIESYTGQSFGYSVGTDTYIGNGTGKLVFNKRAIQINGVLGGYAMYESNWTVQARDTLGNLLVDTNGQPIMLTNEIGQLNLDKVGLIQDGWACVFNWPEFLDVRESPPLELIQFAPAQDGTIRVPRRVMRERDKGAHYTITGEWGYLTVPEDVQQAALLLANDYIAGDSEYRDRYLSILKIQQDSFTYHPGAFRGTGNARVDLLLGPYRRQNGMVIL